MDVVTVDVAVLDLVAVDVAVDVEDVRVEVSWRGWKVYSVGDATKKANNNSGPQIISKNYITRHTHTNVTMHI